MWITREWLNSLVDIADRPTEEIADRMTNAGVPVEVLTPLDPGLSGIVVGHVLTVVPHPDADRLRVCTVDVGGEAPLQIVCGAPNVRPGMRVPTALVGASLPDLTIKKAKLRGVESQGMLCSAKEIGLNTRLLRKEQTEGLYTLPDDAQIGADIRDVLMLRDVAMELDLTPNRSDCLSVRGVAFEVASIYNRSLTFEGDHTAALSAKESDVEVELQSSRCELYTALCVNGVKIGPSPLWLQTRLMAVGVRPVNNIVDVTNYVMFEYGQPLHAFDRRQIQGDRIIVRQAVQGEILVTLDGVERELDPSMLVIADATRPIGLAGVMGGENSEVTSQTTDIVLESAWFEPYSTRATVKELGLRSEASLRFEKGVDPDQIIPAVVRAAELITQIAGGEAMGVRLTGESVTRKAVPILLRPAKVREHLGVDLDASAIAEILDRLRFPYRLEEEALAVVVPTRRPDVATEVDLVEEIARLYGYDRIPTTFPVGSLTQGKLSTEAYWSRILRSVLIGQGMSEVVTYSFTNPDWGSAGGDRSFGLPSPISLLHPMSDERRTLRTSMIPSLLEVAAYNLNRQMSHVSLFEFGRVYHAASLPLTELPHERTVLAGLLSGRPERSFGHQAEALDFFDAKGCTEAVLQALGLTDVVYEAANIPWMHPTRTAEIRVENSTIGYVGQVHPDVSTRFDIKDAYYFELDMASLLCHTEFTIRVTALPRFPSVERDLALVVKRTIPVGSLESVIRQSAGAALEQLKLFDVYTGAPVADDEKSVAFRLTYRAADRTLTDEEIGAYQAKVVRALDEQFGATLRT